MAYRIEVIQEGLAQGLRTDQIDKRLHEEEIKLGKETEKNFVMNLQSHFDWLVKSVEKGSEQDDHDGVDFWLAFKNNRAFPRLRGMRLPAQVKSSPERVNEFKNSSKYKDLGKKVLVIDAHKKISRKDFKDQIFKELRRIDGLLTKTPEKVHS
jgi:hypothetical protein